MPVNPFSISRKLRCAPNYKPPNRRAKIDWDRPLSRGLVFCSLFNDGDINATDLVTGFRVAPLRGGLQQEGGFYQSPYGWQGKVFSWSSGGNTEGYSFPYAAAPPGWDALFTSAPTAFTLMAWVNTDSVSSVGAGAVMSRWNNNSGANRQWMFTSGGAGTNGPVVNFSQGGSSTQFGAQSNTATFDHVWTHICATIAIDASFNVTVNWYTFAVSDSANPQTGNMGGALHADPDEWVCLGADKQTFDDFYGGGAADLRIYSRVLTQEEIRQCYTGEDQIFIYDNEISDLYLPTPFVTASSVGHNPFALSWKNRPKQYKPQGIPRIDWDHPLANGLTSYWWDTGAGFYVDLISGAKTHVGAGSGKSTQPPATVTAFGSATAFNGTTYSQQSDVNPNSDAWVSNFSYAAGFVQLGNMSGSNAGIFGVADSGGNDPVMFYWPGGGGTLGVSYGNVAGVNFSGVTESTLLNKLTVVVGTAPTTSSQLSYLNGGAGVASAVNPSGYTGTNMGYCFGNVGIDEVFGAGTTPNIALFFGAIWRNRTLTAEEAKQLYLDPYCFLLAPQPDQPLLPQPVITSSVLDSGVKTPAGSVVTSASVTFAPNTLVIATIEVRWTNAPGSNVFSVTWPSGLTPIGGGYGQLDEEIMCVTTSSRTLAVFGAMVGSSPVTGAIIFTEGSAQSYNGDACVTVLQFAGVNTASPIGTVGAAHDPSPSTGGFALGPLTIPGTLLPNDITYNVFGVMDNPNTYVITPSSWSLLVETGPGSDTRVRHYVNTLARDQSPSWTWATSQVNSSAVGFIIRAAVAGGPTTVSATGAASGSGTAVGVGVGDTFLRPDADATLGGWTNQAGATSGVYQSIDEPAPAVDTDFAQSSPGSVTTTMAGYMPASVAANVRAKWMVPNYGPPPRIDWDHPITRGLFLCTIGSHPFIDLTGKQKCTLVGAPIMSASPEGPGLWTGDRSGAYTTASNVLNWGLPPELITGGNVTFVARVMPKAYAGVDNGEYNSLWSLGGASDMIYSLAIDANMAAGVHNVVFEVQNTSNIYQDSPTFTTPPINQMAHVVGIVTSGSLMRAQLNASISGTTSMGGVPPKTAIPGTHNLYQGADQFLSTDGGRYFDGIFNFGACWNRDLTDEELKLLYLDPYCFLLPPRPDAPVLGVNTITVTMLAAGGYNPQTLRPKLRPKLYKPRPVSRIDWDQPLANGLAAAFVLNEGAGRINDLVSGSNAGTLNTGVAWTVTANGIEISFDGAATGHSISLAQNSVIQNLNYFSIAMSGFTSDVTQQQPAGVNESWFGQFNDASNYLRVTQGDQAGVSPNGQITFAHKVAGTEVSVTTQNVVASNNILIDWCGTWDGTNHHIYTNGVDQPLFVTTAGQYGAGVAGTTIGSRAGGDGAWKGNIRYCFIWNRPLTIEEARLVFFDPYSFLLPGQPNLPMILPGKSDLARFRISDPATGFVLGNPVKIRYRYGSTAVGASILIVRLKQGSTVIKTWMHTDASPTYQTVEQTLTTGELSTITDFTNLFVEFEATV